jgi:hypothetical protein
MGIWQNIKDAIKAIFTPVCVHCGSTKNVKAYEIDGQAFFFCNKLACQKRLKLLKRLS